MINIGVLGSTKGTDLQEILDKKKKKILKASITVVISNREKAFILHRAKNHGVSAKFISHKKKTRVEFDREVTAQLEKYNVDLVLLIGFMRILSNEFCKRWQDKILNVHPSLLPKYAGGIDTNVHEQVLVNGDKKTGCTIHFVTEKVDAGPIIVQKSCQVIKDDNVDTLKQKVQALEGKAFIEAINLITKK